MSDQKDPMVYVKAIRRKADILIKDAHRTPRRIGMAQQAESIHALCALLEESLK